MSDLNNATPRPDEPDDAGDDVVMQTLWARLRPEGLEALDIHARIRQTMALDARGRYRRAYRSLHGFRSAWRVPGFLAGVAAAAAVVLLAFGVGLFEFAGGQPAMAAVTQDEMAAFAHRVTNLQSGLDFVSTLAEEAQPPTELPRAYADVRESGEHLIARMQLQKQPPPAYFLSFTQQVVSTLDSLQHEWPSLQHERLGEYRERLTPPTDFFAFLTPEALNTSVPVPPTPTRTQSPQTDLTVSFSDVLPLALPDIVSRGDTDALVVFQLLAEQSGDAQQRRWVSAAQDAIRRARAVTPNFPVSTPAAGVRMEPLGNGQYTLIYRGDASAYASQLRFAFHDFQFMSNGPPRSALVVIGEDTPRQNSPPFPPPTFVPQGQRMPWLVECFVEGTADGGVQLMMFIPDGDRTVRCRYDSREAFAQTWPQLHLLMPKR